MKLEKWLEVKKPKTRSKLDEHFEAISVLVEEGYTHLQIVEFLSLNGVKTTRRNLSFFISQKIKNTKPTKAKPSAHKPEESKVEGQKPKEKSGEKKPTSSSTQVIVEKLRKMKESEVRADWSTKFAEMIGKPEK